jgi:steroid 5-alpha reductase family enzyme
MFNFLNKIKSRLFQIILFSLVFYIFFQIENFQNFLLINLISQIFIFLFIVCLPAYFTDRMSYVDIAWPFGLVAIGIISFFCGDGYLLKKSIISMLYIIAGLRMGIGALILLKKGYLNKELPRYSYQRIRWKKKGFVNDKFSVQYEILLQCFANATFLAIPAILISNNSSQTFSIIEVIGFLVWVIFFFLEHISDLQKQKFLINAKKNNLKNQVCDIGLWKYTRHPNYFSEWMIWNGLIIASFSSLLLNNSMIVFLGTTISLLYITILMYQTLVFLTGAIPSEYYSLIRRPDYKKYKQTTNMFFPNFFK